MIQSTIEKQGIVEVECDKAILIGGHMGCNSNTYKYGGVVTRQKDWGEVQCTIMYKSKVIWK